MIPERPLADPAIVGRTAELMRLLADRTRLRIIALLQTGEMNVSALCDAIQLAQPTVSHHLGLLRAAKLVRTRREGKQVHYSLNAEHILCADDGTLRVSAPTVKVTLTLPAGASARRSPMLAACG